MNNSDVREKTMYWRVPQLDGVDLFRATFFSHSFSRHIHEGYAIGVIEKGSLAFTYRGEKVVAPSGAINLVVPGEAHDGHAATDAGWSYRMFYFDTWRLENAAHEISGHKSAFPFFKAGVIRDCDLAEKIRHLHMMLENRQNTLLESESRLLSLLNEFILRHATQPSTEKQARKDPRAVKLVKEYIEAHYDQNMTLRQLSILVHLSPFHLLRTFRDQIGVPPHVYLRQIRINRVKELLQTQQSLSRIALDAGFTDQSHLTKQFKQILGLTPLQYRNFVQ